MNLGIYKDFYPIDFANTNEIFSSSSRYPKSRVPRREEKKKRKKKLLHAIPCHSELCIVIFNTCA